MKRTAGVIELVLAIYAATHHPIGAFVRFGGRHSISVRSVILQPHRPGIFVSSAVPSTETTLGDIL